jgi:RHS repeat-associated protein
MTQLNKGSGMFRKLFVTAWLLMAWLCGIPAMAAPSLTALATPASAVAPASVTLSVIVNADPDPVTVTQVEYFNGSTSLGVATGAPFSLALSNVAAGTYNIVAQATLADQQYPVLISAPIPLTVTGSTPGANVYYIQTDQLNTPRAITDQSNGLVWKWDSDPFGSTHPNEKPVTNSAFEFNQRHPGQYFDKESNLYYNYNRDFDPQIGRYVQSDPIGLKGGANTYTYVAGNPLLYIDPFGLEKASTIQCDGNGKYEMVINDVGPGRSCTIIHERSHIDDWEKRYGKDSCNGKPKGHIPTGSINGDNYRDFLRDSECRAYEAEKSCDQNCNNSNVMKQYRQGVSKNYCEDYDTWRRKQ